MASTSDAHMQDAPLLLNILGEAVGQQTFAHATDDDAVPLLAFDLVDG